MDTHHTPRPRRHAIRRGPAGMRRAGMSLAEVLVALVVLAATAAWSLTAAAGALRAITLRDAHRLAVQRAELGLATLEALDCDSIAVPPLPRERRWVVRQARRRHGAAVHDAVSVLPVAADSVTLHRDAWCR
ncbi:MAG: prepilin-type N-terminal cleavage/methylation domain-containing protein [Gemmatimonadaceae bacterium]|nr:prepilin-type N-terminal cleavage/methylation domain-containing protein [Gemmatimonadaceae bacterium]